MLIVRELVTNGIATIAVTGERRQIYLKKKTTFLDSLGPKTQRSAKISGLNFYHVTISLTEKLKNLFRGPC